MYKRIIDVTGLLAVLVCGLCRGQREERKMKRKKGKGLKTAAMLFALLLVGDMSIVAFADNYATKTESFSCGGEYEGYIYAPSLDSGARMLTFVDAIDYLPEGDDDFCFNIVQEEGRRYLVQTTGGNRRSKVCGLLNSWEIPDYVSWKRKYIELKGNSDYEAASIEVPNGCNAVTIVELLTYWPAGDDDYSYAARAMATGRSVIVSAISDFGNQHSQVALRVTVLYWGSEAPVSWQVGSLAATMSGGMYMDVESGYRYIATPTAYMTDTTRYKYERFNDLVSAMHEESFAGRKISVWGIVGDSFSIVSGGPPLSPGTAARFAQKVASTALKVLSTKTSTMASCTAAATSGNGGTVFDAFAFSR